MSNIKSTLRVVGSLWFATALLLILMLAMGSATIFETTHGLDQTRAFFYHSPWFKGLLALFALNILAAMLLRLPFKRRQLPFVSAHIGLLIILAGALCTDMIGLDGKLVLMEGETGSYFTTYNDTLGLHPKGTQKGSTLVVEEYVGGVYKPVELSGVARLSTDDITVRALRYMPDFAWKKEMGNESPTPNLALQVVLDAGKDEKPIWITAGSSKILGSVFATVTEYKDNNELDKAVAAVKARNRESRVTIVVAGKTYAYPISACLNKDVGIDKTGYTLKVLRYLPHAVMGENNEALNVSDQPVNPAVEVSISGNGKEEVRLVFAKFPDIISTLSGDGLADIKVGFITTEETDTPKSHAPIEIMVGPKRNMIVRFAWQGAKESTQALSVGTPLQTPFPGKKLTVLQYFDNAKEVVKEYTPDPVRKNPQPALEVEITTPESSKKMWLQKYHSIVVQGKKGAYDLSYQDQPNKLDFNIKLKSFHVGYYPGGMRPRTFESSVIFEDPETGITSNQLISMNHPGSYKGYTFYQSSYNTSKAGTASILSVSKDPGLLIVYLGYFLTVGGMLWLLIERMLREKKRNQAVDAEKGGLV